MRPKYTGAAAAGVAAGGAAGGAQELALELRPVRSPPLPWPVRLTGAADIGAVTPAMAAIPVTLMHRRMATAAMRRPTPTAAMDRPTPTAGMGPRTTDPPTCAR